MFSTPLRIALIAGFALPAAVAVQAQPSALLQGYLTKPQFLSVSPGPTQIIATTACTGTKQPKPLKVSIKKLLKGLASANQTVERDITVGTVPVPLPATYGGNELKTRLDMELRKAILPPDGWLEIQIILPKGTNPNAAGNTIVFMRPEGSSADDSSFAVTAGGGNPEMFCGRKPIATLGNDRDVVIFGIQGTPRGAASLNIGLLIPDHGNPGFVIPIILDPKIKNSG